MKEFEAKYRLVLDTVKLIAPAVGSAIFCGGTALNTFYLDYRYSEDLDFCYQYGNPKVQIEKLLEANGYSVKRTALKIRDVLNLGGIEIKMDVFEYEPLSAEIVKSELEGVQIRIPSFREFALLKIVSFLTREEIGGMARDAYDLYMMQRKADITGLISKQRRLIRSRIVSLQHNFSRFNENKGKIEQSVHYLLKDDVGYETVKKFLKKLERCLQ